MNRLNLERPEQRSRAGMRRTWGAVTAVSVAGLLTLGGWSASESRAQGSSTPASPAPLAGKWAVDAAHTNVNFAIRHMGISTIRGRFNDVAGTIVADAAHPEKNSVEVTIQTASIDTGVKLRDDHVRSADFLDVEKYPTMTFRSKRVEKRKDGFVAHGTLTLHGTAREVSLPFRVAGPVKDQHTGSRFGVETKLRLNRQDYGLKYHQVLDNGALALANDVDITISLEAVPDKPAAAAAR